MRHARQSHIYEYEDAEMVRGCENLRGTIKRNSKYRDPGQLSLPTDPSTEQLPEMILQVPDYPEAEYMPFSIREQTRARMPKVRSVAWRTPPPRELESTPGAMELRVEKQTLLEEYHRVSEAQNLAKFGKLEEE